MTARYWDGCTRMVVSRRIIRDGASKLVHLEKLECGHEQMAPGGMVTRRVCWQCVVEKSGVRP